MTEDEKKDVQTYFNKLGSVVKNHSRQMSQVSQIQEKITKQIDDGSIDVKERQIKNVTIQKIIQQIKNKKQKMNKDLMLLNFNLSKSLYLGKRDSTQSKRVSSTRSFRKQSTSLSLQEIDQYRNRKISAEKRLKELNKIKQQLIKKKLKTQEDKQLKRINQIQVERQLQQNRKAEYKINKILKIKQRMKELEENRAERIKSLKSSYVSSAPNLPKYIKMQIEFYKKSEQKQRVKRQQVKQSIKSKNQQYNYKNVKLHEQNYNKTLQRRNINKKKTPSKIQKDMFQKREKQFNRLFSQNPEKQEKSKQKLRRIKNYQQVARLKRIIMKKDSQIGLNIQITKDKEKNPFKYHYLRKKKHITDEQIYENYNHFNFNSDPIEKGNYYLQEIKNNSKSRIRNYNSGRKAIKTQGSSTPQKKNYINYLQDSKKNSILKKKDQVEQLIKQYGQKSKVLQILQNKSQIQRASAMKKIMNLQNPNSYAKTLKLQQEIDGQFINSIKTKIKCLQIK